MNIKGFNLKYASYCRFLSCSIFFNILPLLAVVIASKSQILSLSDAKELTDLQSAVNGICHVKVGTS